ncbi:MAG: chaperone NapD [Rubrivivax sp.]|nr:chaperone NapD [Rubrivivax sp.]
MSARNPASMNLSGILVTAEAAQIDAVRAALAQLPGVTVDRFDRGTGRLVVIQEAADVQAEMAGFLRIRALPHVLATDLVVHHFEPPGQGDPGPAPTAAAPPDAPMHPRRTPP